PNDQKKVSAVKSEHTNTAGIICMKYSPSGGILAVGCRDSCIYILNAELNYRKMSVYRGHRASVVRLDLSGESLHLESNDIARELLYWDVQTGKQITNTSLTRDIEWASWTCVFGWPVQGATHIREGNEFGIVCRSPDATTLATSCKNRIKLSRYPALDKSES